MTFIRHNPEDVSAPIGGYSHGSEVRNPARLLFISGQIPELPGGQVPESFSEQCEAVWHNIETILASAGMSVVNLVKITTFLTDKSQVVTNGEIRRRHLGEHKPALTVIIAETLESHWLLEIEAIAAADD
jgi:enamine deaminase RidA (YjgF/YER057c/UK114 family)